MLPKEYFKQIDLIKMTKQILNIKDAESSEQDDERKKYKYVLISQSHPSIMDRHISEIPARFFIKEYQKPGWGYGLFVVNEDGFLKLIETNFDSSD